MPWQISQLTARAFSDERVVLGGELSQAVVSYRRGPLRGRRRRVIDAVGLELFVCISFGKRFACTIGSGTSALVAVTCVLVCRGVDHEGQVGVLGGRVGIGLEAAEHALADLVFSIVARIVDVSEEFR